MGEHNEKEKKWSASQKLTLAYALTLPFLFAISGLLVWGTEHERYQAIATDTVNLRKGPGITYDVKDQVHQGTNYRVIATQNQWEEILLSDGETGWIPNWLTGASLALDTDNPIGTGFIATALSDTQAHEEANDEAPGIGSVPKDSKYSILFQRDGWLEIQLADSVGWIKQGSVEITPGNIPFDKKTTPFSEDDLADPNFLDQYEYQIVAEAAGAHIRQEPDVNSPLIYKAKRKEPLAYLGQTGAFYHVQTSDGTTGYIANWLASSNVTIVQRLADETQPTSTLKDKTIVLDPGHGGKDTGAISADESVYEKDVTLKTARAAKQVLEDAGAHVLLTRDQDIFIDPLERPELAVMENADAFISLHYDSLVEDPTVSGTTVYLRNDQSLPLAKFIQAALLEEDPLASNGYRSEDYKVLRKAEVPSVLLELGYMSNEKDIAVFTKDDYYDTVAHAIKDALTLYFNDDADALLDRIENYQPESNANKNE